MVERLLPKYKNPPINEVYLGITFTPLNKMKAAYIGLFWNIVKKEFPKCEQAQVIGNLDDVIEKDLGYPVPRTWLVNKEDDHLIQIQKNKFLLNWRKREKSYPHFTEILKMFLKHLKNFSNFISENNLGSIEYNNFELTYMNHIPKGEGWEDIKLISNLLPDITWKDDERRFLHEPETIIWRSEFKLPEDSGKLIVKLQPGSRIIDKHPLIILEISASGIGSDKTNKGMNKWFNMAHEWIVLSFEDLTSDDVQNDIWGKIGNA